MSGDHRIGRDGSPLTVLYDRDCGICGVTARTLSRWDRDHRFRIMALQEVDPCSGTRLSEAVVGYALADELHVVDLAGRVATGGDAALAILDGLPGGRLLRPWAAVPLVRWLVGSGYGWVATNRASIGRWFGLELACGASVDGRAQASSPRSR